MTICLPGYGDMVYIYLSVLGVSHVLHYIYGGCIYCMVTNDSLYNIVICYVSHKRRLMSQLLDLAGVWRGTVDVVLPYVTTYYPIPIYMLVSVYIMIYQYGSI
jgi:hypothetical protein